MGNLLKLDMISVDSMGAAATPSFTSSWKTDNAGTSNSTSITLPLDGVGPNNFDVDWGDGTSTLGHTGTAPLTHDYVSSGGAGTYDVVITGTIKGFRFNNGADKLKLLNISRFGPLRLGNGNGYFYGASNMTITATDVLDMTGTTTMLRGFTSCSSLTTVPSMDSWDMSAVTNMQVTLFGATNFNQDIGSWDTSSVTSMSNLFQNNTAFNQDISGWETNLVTSMLSMFEGATSFNNGGTAMNTVGNQWNTSAVTTMQEMFSGATAFDQDLSSWDITAVVAPGMIDMFLGVTLSTANYDALLIGWEGQVEPAGITFSGGNSLYSAGAAATAHAALASNGWIITDGGPA